MVKIQITHSFVDTGYLYVVDEDGKIWKKLLSGDAWEAAGELPEKEQLAVRQSNINL
jgi:hypothetical protein